MFEWHRWEEDGSEGWRMKPWAAAVTWTLLAVFIWTAIVFVVIS